MSKAVIIPKELAEEQLELLFDYYEMDLEEMLLEDEDDVDDKSQAAAQRAAKQLKRKLTKAIMYGRLELTEGETGGLTIIQHLKLPSKSGPQQLKWSGLTGVAKTKLKDMDKGSAFNKMYGFAAAVTKTSIQTIMELKDMDLVTAESLIFVLLRV